MSTNSVKRSAMLRVDGVADVLVLAGRDIGPAGVAEREEAVGPGRPRRRTEVATDEGAYVLGKGNAERGCLFACTPKLLDREG